MKIASIFYSHSGNTRSVATKIQETLGGELIEVSPEKEYSSLMIYTKGCYRALKGLKDSVKPDKIDVSDYDLIVLASPVWAGKPTPVINGVINVLQGCEGKKAFVFMTCKDAKSGKEAINLFKANILARGLVISGEAVLDKNMVDDKTSIDDIITSIRSSDDGA